MRQFMIRYKRLTALLLAALICLSLAAPAMADGELVDVTDAAAEDEIEDMADAIGDSQDETPAAVDITPAVADVTGDVADVGAFDGEEPPVSDGDAVRFVAAVSSNISDNDYEVWADVVNSYLVENSDGTLTRVEYIAGTGVVVETWSSSGAVQSSEVIAAELPLFGGFFAGQTYNFFVFGQMNAEEDDSVEVLRVVKYSKSWQRLGSLSVTGANTYLPFDGGSLRMAETAGKLYIHTCHTMYTYTDGYQHQANMTFVVTESTMALADSYTGIMNIAYGFVSHSFNQFVQTDGSYVYRVDHGDANPRAVCVTRCPVSGRITNVTYGDALTIPGESGLNATGVSVGGFEIGASKLLIAGNAVDVSDEETYSPYGQRNIFVSAVSPDLSGGTVTWLTDYGSDSAVTPRTPQLVKLSGTRFLVMWEEYNSAAGTVKLRLCLVNDSGARIGSVAETNMRLSDCQPIVTSDGLVTWYMTSDITTLYKVDPYALDDIDSGTGDYIAYGLCGDAAWWTLTADGLLTIEGSGAVTEDSWYGYSDSITDVTVGEGITSLPDYAFVYCSSLVSAVLPEGLTGIPTGAFWLCTGLRRVVIPASVTTVGTYAFYRCTSLADVYCTGTAASWGGVTVGNYNSALIAASFHYNYTPGTPYFAWADDHSAATVAYTAANGALAAADATVTAALASTTSGGVVTARSFTTSDGYTTNRVTYTARATVNGETVTNRVYAYGVFGGWYRDAAFTTPYTSQPASGAVKYARLVDPAVLTVKYQLKNPTYSTDSSTRFRVVTTVDSLDYASVGFVLRYTRPSDGTAVSRTLTTQRVYSRITGSGSLGSFNYAPTVFSSESVYFCAYTMNLPSALFDVTLRLRPTWTTADGTVVYGTARNITATGSASFVTV